MPTDEYESYVPRIAALLAGEVTEREIEEELRRIRAEKMKDEEEWKPDSLAAAKIAEWYADVRQA